MKRNLKFLLLVFIFAVCLGFNSKEVSATTMKRGDHYKYSDCGLSGEGAKWDYTVYKTIGGDDAYCIEEKVKACTSVSLANDTRHSEPAKIFAGLAWDNVKASVTKNYSSSCKVDKLRYVYMFMLLNSYYRKDPDNINSKYRSSSVDFTTGKKNGDIKKIYDETIKQKKEITSAALNKGEINSSSLVLSSLNGSNTNYVSQSINISNLTTELMGENPTYTVKVSVTGNGTASICSKANGTGCNGDSATISGRNSSYSFYTRVDGADADTVVTVNVKGNVCRKYSKLTYYQKGGGCQDIARNVGGTSETCKTSNISKKFGIRVPSEKYSVSLYKYDDEGNNVDDAEFSMTINNSPIDLTKEGHYFSNNDLTTSLSGAKVCYTETKVPSGFVKPTESQSCFDVPASGSSACYDADGGVQDSKYCDAYKYMCEDSSAEGGYKDPDTNGDCVYDISTDVQKKCYQIIPSGEDGVPDIPLEAEDTNCTSGTEGYEYRCPDNNASDGSGTSPVGADGTCPSSTGTTKDLTKRHCVVSNGAGGFTVGEDLYCGVDHSNYTKVDFNSNSLVLSTINNKNTVSISKKALTGDDEIPGATLKICSKSSYDSDGANCSVAQTVDKKDMEWTSSYEAKVINGVPTGDYYIIETIPPAGYKTATTATPFTIDSEGNVKVGDQISTDPLVVHNTLNEVTISKTDMASTKELPGAKLSICLTTYDRGSGSTDSTEETTEEDEGEDSDSAADEGGAEGLLADVEGNCIPALDAEGNETTWISGDTPHKIQGLPAGTYFLVEITAPNGFATAESIQFTMNADGTITDKNGKSLADNKLVMKDATIQQVKTGRTIMVIAIVVAVVAVGLGSYFVVGRKKLFSTGEGIMLHSRAKLRRKK